MNDVLKILLYGTILLGAGIAGYRLYKVLNQKIKGAQTGWQLLGYSLLLIVAFALLATASLYLFVELYAFLAKPQP